MRRTDITSAVVYSHIVRRAAVIIKETLFGLFVLMFGLEIDFEGPVCSLYVFSYLRFFLVESNMKVLNIQLTIILRENVNRCFFFDGYTV